jgi:hypothetical protein
MRHIAKAILLITVMCSLQACGTSVQPGERGLRWVLLASPLEPSVPLRREMAQLHGRG